MHALEFRDIVYFSVYNNPLEISRSEGGGGTQTWQSVTYEVVCGVVLWSSCQRSVASSCVVVRTFATSSVVYSLSCFVAMAGDWGGGVSGTEAR